MKKKIIIPIILIIIIIFIVCTFIIKVNNKNILKYECKGPETNMPTYSITPYYYFSFENDKFKTGEMNYIIKFNDEKLFLNYNFEFIDKNDGYEIEYDYDNLTRKYVYHNINYNNQDLTLDDYLEVIEKDKFTCVIK